MNIMGHFSDVFGGGAVAVASVATASAATPYTVVPAPVLVASVIGMVIGIILGDPIEPRGKLFRHAFAYTVLGAAAATFVPFLMGWALTDAQAASFAVVVSAAMRKLWPAITDNFGPWLASINPFRKQ